MVQDRRARHSSGSQARAPACRARVLPQALPRSSPGSLGRHGLPSLLPAGLVLPHICLEGRSPAAGTRCSGCARRALGGCWCSHRCTGASASACRTRGLGQRWRRPPSDEPSGSWAAAPAHRPLTALAQRSESPPPRVWRELSGLRCGGQAGQEELRRQATRPQVSRL